MELTCKTGKWVALYAERSSGSDGFGGIGLVGRLTEEICTPYVLYCMLRRCVVLYSVRAGRRGGLRSNKTAYRIP